MRVSATSAVRPRPSDSTTEGVSAPGLWIAASAMRHSTKRDRGARRAKKATPKATSTQREKRRDSRARDHRRDRLLRAGQDGERDERRARERGAGEIARARPASAFLDEVADQRRSQADHARAQAGRSRKRAPSTVRTTSPRPMRLGEIEGASGIGSKDPNSQLTANGIAEPSSRAERARRSAPQSRTR